MFFGPLSGPRHTKNTHLYRVARNQVLSQKTTGKKMLKRFVITACCAITLLGYSALATSPIGSKAESVIINNQGENVGKALYVQGSEGVVITVDVKGLPAGKHGMHFHQKGTCADHKAFKGAQGHIMLSGRPHGFLNTEGGPHEGIYPTSSLSRTALRMLSSIANSFR